MEKVKETKNFILKVYHIVYDLHNNADANGTADTSSKKSGILRIIYENASIRKGNYGNYIFYKNSKMKKPRFLKLDGFSCDYLTCELTILQGWFKTKYDI